MFIQPHHNFTVVVLGQSCMTTMRSFPLAALGKLGYQSGFNIATATHASLSTTTTNCTLQLIYIQPRT